MLLLDLGKALVFSTLALACLAVPELAFRTFLRLAHTQTFAADVTPVTFGTLSALHFLGTLFVGYTLAFAGFPLVVFVLARERFLALTLTTRLVPL